MAYGRMDSIYNMSSPWYITDDRETYRVLRLWSNIDVEHEIATVYSNQVTDIGTNFSIFFMDGRVTTGYESGGSHVVCSSVWNGTTASASHYHGSYPTNAWGFGSYEYGYEGVNSDVSGWTDWMYYTQNLGKLGLLKINASNQSFISSGGQCGHLPVIYSSGSGTGSSPFIALGFASYSIVIGSTTTTCKHLIWLIWPAWSTSGTPSSGYNPTKWYSSNSLSGFNASRDSRMLKCLIGDRFNGKLKSGSFNIIWVYYAHTPSTSAKIGSVTNVSWSDKQVNTSSLTQLGIASFKVYKPNTSTQMTMYAKIVI